jgi:hypothetical protein
MRKLRRLPWRLPKPQNATPQPAPAPVQSRNAPEPVERRAPEPRNTEVQQPVAYTAGRYVYGYTTRTTPNETRRSRPRQRP